jgi:hypothetical protein
MRLSTLLDEKATANPRGEFSTLDLAEAPLLIQLLNSKLMSS